MMKSKWGACALGLVMAMSFMAKSNALAADSCASLQEENARLKQENAELKAAFGQAPSQTPSQPPEPCSSIDLRNAKLHDKCITSKGSVFERVSRVGFGEAWKGPDGLIWGDRVGSNNYPDAVTVCRNLEGTLPSKADFERGEAYGFREVLPNLKNQFFVTYTTLAPDDPDYAYFFNGFNGGFEHYYLTAKKSFRCVGR